jgi:hypothetical protein
MLKGQWAYHCNMQSRSNINKNTSLLMLFWARVPLYMYFEARVPVYMYFEARVPMWLLGWRVGC